MNINEVFYSARERVAKLVCQVDPHLAEDITSERQRGEINRRWVDFLKDPLIGVGSDAEKKHHKKQGFGYCAINLKRIKEEVISGR